MPNHHTTYLKDYAPPQFDIEKVYLSIDLYEDHALVTNEMTLHRRGPGPLCLMGDELTLVSIHLNQHVLQASDYQLLEKDLIIPNIETNCKITIVTRIEPQKNTVLSGLYRSDGLFCTQCEAEGFRRITYFLDRPDVLTVYTTRISADKTLYPVLLSNGNWQAGGDEANGRHFAVWHDPFKKPSYLFALVAGPLLCVQDTFETMSGRMIDLRIYVESGNEDKCHHAMHALKKAMRWDEERFGREYDLDLFMIVAVKDFNMGAMENKGLNIFNAKYILARPDTATDVDYMDIEGVVGHEYFHNWTGNRVTCRDWFQLSLKEGLTVFRDQEFSRDMHSRDVLRILDVKALWQTQFPEDAGTMAHPVQPTSYEEINNFYTATIYNKGAEVIRMIETILGRTGFRKGMDLYFKRHDGQAVTINDFVAAMADANHYDFSAFMRWYTQAGTPTVTLEAEQYDAATQTLTLSFEQTCPPTPGQSEKQPFVIPIRYQLYDRFGEPMLPEADVLLLTEQKQTFTLKQVKEDPNIALLQDYSAPIYLKRDLAFDDWLALLRFETNGFVKWDIANRLAQDEILRCYESDVETWVIQPRLLAVYLDILNDETLSCALRAELLTSPSFEIVSSSVPEVDVERLEAAREFFKSSVANALVKDAVLIYKSLWKQEDHAFHADAFGRRRLRHVCLSMMMRARHTEALALCQTQYQSACTMTDQLNSFLLLVNDPSESVRLQAIEDFYQQWSQDDLVMDKWFSVQAMCEVSGTLARVKALLKHPQWTITNPNKVRAVVGAFCMGNPRQFHDASGAGYTFLTDFLLTYDAINAQVAARLVTPFTRWRKLDKPRQQLIKKCLTVLQEANLSDDVRELVTKSLI